MAQLQLFVCLESHRVPWLSCSFLCVLCLIGCMAQLQLFVCLVSHRAAWLSCSFMCVLCLIGLHGSAAAFCVSCVS